MEKDLDITKPRYSEHIFSVSWHFVISRFHFNFTPNLTLTHREGNIFFLLPSLGKLVFDSSVQCPLSDETVKMSHFAQMYMSLIFELLLDHCQQSYVVKR